MHIVSITKSDVTSEGVSQLPGSERRPPSPTSKTGPSGQRCETELIKRIEGKVKSHERLRLKTDLFSLRLGCRKKCNHGTAP